MADQITSQALLAGRSRRRRRSRVWVVALLGVLAVVAVPCLLAPVFATHDHRALSDLTFAPPTGDHLLGTDDLGRDVFSRILFAGQTSLLVGAGAAALATAIGLIWGMGGGFARQWADEALMRLADVLMAVPQLLLALIFVAAFGSSPLTLTVVIGILLSPVSARLIRGVALAELGSEYHLAAIAYGAPVTQRLAREVLPNIGAAVAVQFALNLVNAMLIEASLSFVGVGLQDPDLSWGLLVQAGFGLMTRNLGLVLFPSLMIFLTVFVVNLLVEEFESRQQWKERLG